MKGAGEASDSYANDVHACPPMRQYSNEVTFQNRARANTGMNPTRSAIAPRAGYADRWADNV